MARRTLLVAGLLLFVTGAPAAAIGNSVPPATVNPGIPPDIAPHNPGVPR